MVLPLVELRVLLCHGHTGTKVGRFYVASWKCNLRRLHTVDFECLLSTIDCQTVE